MSPRGGSRAGRHETPRSAQDLHRAWLALVETDGPFLSVPALRRAWPQGMPPLGEEPARALRDARPAFESAWQTWDERRGDAVALDRYREARDAWVPSVLREVLGWGESYAPGAGSVPAVTTPDGFGRIVADAVLARDDLVGALVLVVDPVDSLHDPVDDGWAASPVDRMEELLRRSGVLVGVVTDGRWWAVVSARPGTAVASGVVDALTWVEERAVLAAFAVLLSRRSLLGRDPRTRLTEVFADSVAAAEDITVALGTQVRRAVELLVQGFSEGALERAAGGDDAALPDDPEQVYEAAVTVMMRAVFLLFAEERNLLPQSRLFSAGYGISGELARLQARAGAGTEALDGSSSTWHRLLATSEALFRGASFEDLRLPAYGGSLFDGARFPFLTRRTPHGALVVSVDDRVMFEVLKALQLAVLKGEPARQISFRDIDVEQIGYIYEGLLGYSCARVGETTVGLVGKRGLEPELSLAQLEALAAQIRDPRLLAERIRAVVAADQPGATAASVAALSKGLREVDTIEDADRALRAVTDDAELRQRLRPFVGIIRRDLRDRPTVVQPGGLVVVETPSRATAGAHYTPRVLAEEVVEHTLEPLVFSPGPHQTPDRTAWRPLSSEALLDLSVADIACGSGAFLVAAARYLADRLVEAWHREGVAHGTPHDVHVRALRKVVAGCLYGADINGMAVEMCKLSLWLVSLDPKLPFSFVDDKVLHGNSLLGLTDVRQLKARHLDPGAVRGQASVFEMDVDSRLDEAARLRRSLATEVDDADPMRSTVTKLRQWRRHHDVVAQLEDLADGVVAAGLRLGGKPGRALTAAFEDLSIAVDDAYGPAGDRRMLDSILVRGLTPTVTTDYARWKPLHWALAVPDVMSSGGFDAVVGNPPFLGGKKISVASGGNVREYLVNVVGGQTKGNADLVAYFLLRAVSLLRPGGIVGLIATNTLAQGDTREVGLDRLVADGLTITRAVQSRSWPAASANLEYAAVWATRGEVADGAERVCDEVAVSGISSLLEPASRVSGPPLRLAENAGIAFIGCYVLGMGFVLEPEEARQWIGADPRNAEVLFPYLNGEDLNSRPDASPSRWVIDMGERSQEVASKYVLPWARLEAAVKPKRLTYDARKYPRMVDEWWKFWNARPGLRRATADLNEVLVLTRVSKTVMPLRAPNTSIYSDSLVVFATSKAADQAVLSSSMHQLWATNYASTLETRVRYTPSDVFETFPRPASTTALEQCGRLLDTERRAMMLRRGLGLTKLYNLVNDHEVADERDPDVARLRQIHVNLDHAVMAAYGWDDVPLEHGFHTYRQMQRWTISPAARVEVLDRLLEENHRRAAAQSAPPPPVEVDDVEEEA